ncbi:MAG: branched-chain amino acid ABC transporter permease, partial [Alphaproteobacteria bacterium]|nr:branched-chain amino acid ABC transporter permease [Alphaproteobacteria bacterium]
LQATFIVWVMLIAGGSGNNRGAILGALVIWGIWSGSQFMIGALPSEWAVQVAPLRILLIGVLLQVILITRPEGLLPETPPRAATQDKD